MSSALADPCAGSSPATGANSFKMIHEKTIRKIEKTLFSGDMKPKDMSPAEQDIRVRYMALFHLMMERPEKKDIDLVNFLMEEYNISRSQGYIDVGNVKVIFGNVQKTAKEWDRYVVTDMLKTAYNMAKNENKTKDMIAAADKLGKYTKLDQEEGRDIPFDEIVPLNIEPTGDVSVLGLKPIPNLKERQRALRDKYGKIEDVQVINEDDEQTDQE
jgi:hypothetical protein